MQFFQSIKSALSSVSHSSVTSMLAEEDIQQKPTPQHRTSPSSTEIVAASSSIIIHSDQHVEETKLTIKPQEPIPFGLFNQIPSEVIEMHIFPHLDHLWLWRVASLISKEWNNLVLSSPLNLRMIFEKEIQADNFIKSCENGRFRSVISMMIAGNLLPQYLKALVECEKLESLTSLDVGFQIGNSGAFMIGNSKIPNLTKLNFNGNKIGCDGLRQLAKGSSSKNLKYLYLLDNGIQVNGIMFLSNSNLCNLVYLDLSGNYLTTEGMAFIAKGKLSFLVSLIMQRCRINNKSIAALVVGNVQNLTELDLYDNNIGDEGGKAIAHGNLQQLITLNLQSNNITMDVASEIFTNITTLKHFEWNKK